MTRTAVDVRPWNLGIPLVVLAACGRTLLLPDAEGGGGVDETSTADPSDPSGGPSEPGGECRDRIDCPIGFDCIDDVCVQPSSDTACDDDSCCADGCCEEGCSYYDCYGDEDCGSGYTCQAGFCVPEVDEGECFDIPVGFFDAQQIFAPQGVASLAFVDTPDAPGRELLVADDAGIHRLGPDSVTPVTDLRARSFAVGDVDRDGDEDLVVLADDRLHTFVFDGMTFLETTTTTLPAGTDGAIDLLDFDGDGDADAFVRTSVATLQLVGAGDGGFGEALIVAGPACDLVAARSFTQNPPTKDVVYGESGSIWVAAGGASGIFDPYGPATFSLGSACPLGTGDFDDDGNADAVVLDSNGAGTLMWWSAIATIPQTYSWTPPGKHDRLAVGDLDFDGKDDVVLVGGSNEATVRFGHHPALSGSDPLGCFTRLSLAVTPRDLVIGDLDGSGRVDLVLVDEQFVWVMYAAG